MYNTNWLTQLREALQSDVGLYSVMQQVDIGAKNSGKSEKLVPRTLRLDQSFGTNQKGNVLAEFNSDIAVLEKSGLLNDDYTIFHLTQKYGWRVPADKEQGAKGISFFDDLRIEEAVKACKDDHKFRLLKGDLTGIQEFINADINLELVGGASNIARRLRGKSFFVSVLTEFLAESLLLHLELPIWNLLFAGGGHFNILVPADDATKSKIDAWEKSTQIELTAQMNGLLGLVLAGTDCDNTLLTAANIGFDAVNKARDANKYRKGFSYLSGLFASTKGGKLGQGHFEEIGQRVPKYSHLLWLRASVNIKSDDGVVRVYQSVNGQSLWLCDKPSALKSFIQHNQNDIAEVRVLSLNDTDFISEDALLLDGKTSLGFKLVGNETPKDKSNNLKDFEAITKVKDGNGEPMYEMLSVMRLDVDDLGCIFGKGLKEASLKEVVALSREMNYFFAGYFNYLASKHDIYVVYSGGDDAFVVGHWYNMLEFAQTLEQAFRAFTGHNPNIHFSAGIFTCDAHYPVAKFSDDAKTLLEKEAKRMDGKNAISVFNHCLTWSDFNEMMKFGKKLLIYTTVGDQQKGSKLARSVVNRILTIVKNSFYEKTEFDESQQLVKKGGIKPQNFYRNLSNLKYLLARQGFKAGSTDNAVEGSIEGDVIKILLNAFENSKNGNTYTIAANNLRVALNYTLYSLRKPKKDA